MSANDSEFILAVGGWCLVAGVLFHPVMLVPAVILVLIGLS